MGCVRKRGKSWNAQVRVSGWRSFTKSFSKKSDAVIWIKELEHKLRSTPLPDVIIDSKVTLNELLQSFGTNFGAFFHLACFQPLRTITLLNVLSLPISLRKQTY